MEHALPQRSRSRKHYYEGWTPFSMALKLQLHALTEIRRFCLGHHGRSTWSSLGPLQAGLAKIISTWSQRHNRLSLNTDETTDTSFSISLTLPNDFSSSRARLLHVLLTAIPLTLHRLHARMRHERRKHFSSFTSKMEQLLEQRKIGALIRHLLGSSQQTPDLTSFLTEEGTLITDPHAIHDSCTRSADHHSNTRNVLPTETIDWTSKATVLASRDRFITTVSDVIPDSLRSIFLPRIDDLWFGLTYPFQTDLSDRMDTAFTKIHCPTLQEFSISFSINLRRPPAPLQSPMKSYGLFRLTTFGFFTHALASSGLIEMSLSRMTGNGAG